MTGRERRGFAAMSREKQREIARRGGRAAHQKGTAHEFNVDEARAAGRKGGVAVSKNREHMSRIGRTGGLSSRAGRRSVAPRPSSDVHDQPPGEQESTQPHIR
jgi:general stress protein YciG